MVTTAVMVVLGGARSGKSAAAEHLAASTGTSVTYVATGPIPDDTVDADWATRVAAHRARRPGSWATVELGGGDLAATLAAVPGTALVDSLGTWVAGLLDVGVDPAAPGRPGAPLADLLVVLDERRRDGRPTVIVSEEVGLGVHPSSALGGRFRDVLGEVNRAVGDAADTVLLVVAGRVLELAERVPGAGGDR
ncbi:MAG TPA: bifunctional adenosylcobinamide kinase/adenosylcobinamide-phosphate guanylyltransferase [Acidimicrobiales bacterium]|nr:bifunctional adenosylcobinamide kinase/adenosylcobinamide-phosphate guanylyltransferase [Acidimicrobiales bacterium]